MKFLYKYVFILSLLFSFGEVGRGFAQVNLILNPSFEILDSCLTFADQIYIAKPWERMGTTLDPFCSAGILSACCVNPSDCGINAFTNGGVVYQFPRTGNGYCVLEIFSPPPPNTGLTNLRRYTIGKLSNTLVNGKTYCGKVYINLDNLSPYKTNRFGMYFDNGVVQTMQINCYSSINVTAQVQNNPTRMLDDTLGWMKIEGVFTANGTESRITIGNFYTDANTVGLPTGVVNGRYPATYNIDDLSLIATDITAYAGNDATICVTDSVYLGRPQEVGLECLWYKPNVSTPFLNTSDMWFKPTQTGTYTFIQRMDNCAITWDTVNITVVQDCNITPTVTTLSAIPNVFTPNGDGVNDTFEFQVPSLESFKVYNRWGLLIYSGGSSSSPSGRLGGAWDGRTTSGEACTDGVYFYTLSYQLQNGDAEKKNGCITLIR